MMKEQWQNWKRMLHEETRRDKERQREFEALLKRHPVLCALAVIGAIALAGSPLLYFKAFSPAVNVTGPSANFHTMPGLLGTPEQMPTQVLYHYPSLARQSGQWTPQQPQDLEAYGRYLGTVVQSSAQYNNAVRTMVGNHGAAVLGVSPPIQ